MWWNMCLVPFESWELICSLYQVDWRNLMKRLVTVGAQLLWGGRYGCNNGHYGCPIVMSYIEINKAVSQWLLTFNLCISVTWPLTCAFHIPCSTPLKSLICIGACVINIVHTWSRCLCDSNTNRIPYITPPITEQVTSIYRKQNVYHYFFCGICRFSRCIE